MAEVTFEKLINTVTSEGHDTDCIDRFQFACAAKNLTKVTMMGYAERILYLHRFSVQIGKELSALTTRDIQHYIISILKKVSPSHQQKACLLQQDAHLSFQLMLFLLA